MVNKEERFFYTHSARLCNTKPEKTRIALENTLVNALLDLLTVLTRISAAFGRKKLISAAVLIESKSEGVNSVSLIRNS